MTNVNTATQAQADWHRRIKNYAHKHGVTKAVAESEIRRKDALKRKGRV